MSEQRAGVGEMKRGDEGGSGETREGRKRRRRERGAERENEGGSERGNEGGEAGRGGLPLEEVVTEGTWKMKAEQGKLEEEEKQDGKSRPMPLYFLSWILTTRVLSPPASCHSCHTQLRSSFCPVFTTLHVSIHHSPRFLPL
ncbi:hypothetical protein Pmani_000722 [Petrolisthes manimaculis]|uniref:Uncharacterized protein n=1 Tax=Petrolisthes manimaculis TaxID=1843537 RepID=A0AAE1QPH4_9EUCA|nr:hypothetical protein Pmani_000722 [Petrolisthes manimaculis]